MRILWLLLIEREPRRDDPDTPPVTSFWYRVGATIVAGILLAGVVLAVLWVRAHR